MRFKDFLTELNAKQAKQRKDKDLADLHAKQQEKKKNDFEAKYNTGMPTKVKVKVYVKKPAYKQEDPYEYREFTIDNLIDIRHKLQDVTLIDMSSVEDDKGKHDDKITWAIKKDGKQLPGGLPEYLHGLPARTRKKPNFSPYDLRREAWTNTPIPFKESVSVNLTPEYLLKHYKKFVTQYATENNLSVADAAEEISAIRGGKHDVSTANLKNALTASAKTHIGRIGGKK